MEPNVAASSPPEVSGIKIGETTYSAQDVETMLAQQAEATKVLQSHGKMKQLAERYGLSADEFLTNAEGSFSAVSELIEKKIIDEHGNLLVGKKQESEEELYKSLFGGTEPAAPASPRNDNGQSKALVQALMEIRGQTGQLTKEISKLRQDNETLMKHNIMSRLSQSFPGLEPEELELAIERARTDRSMGLSEHVKKLAEKRSGLERLAQVKLARELGIEDLDAHLNRLKVQKERGAGALFEGKTMSFRPKGEKAVTPLEATQTFLMAQSGG